MISHQFEIERTTANIMEVFGKQIHLRQYVCSPQGGYTCANSRVNLYIYASGFCPAKCSFCPGFDSRSKIDLGKLKAAVSELHDKKVINRIGITGGEPLSDLKSLDQILQTIHEVCGEKAYHISVNTNGLNLSSLRNINYFSLLNDVHISRHSINDYENNKIFGINTPTLLQIKHEASLNPEIFSLSCNLLKGYVDSVDTLQSYLTGAILVGVRQAGFVSLMKKTEICTDLFVDYEDISSKLYVSNGFSLDEMSKDKESCRCENFTYYNDKGEIPFYLRRVLGGKADCIKAFVFNQDGNLVTNFGKDMVLL
jgi:hypothetical protein